MSELVADFVDYLPCSEEKVAFDVVAVHCTTCGRRNDDEWTRQVRGWRRRGRARELEGRSYREFFMGGMI
jgi:hypothetical protein